MTDTHWMRRECDDRRYDSRQRERSFCRSVARLPRGLFDAVDEWIVVLCMGGIGAVCTDRMRRKLHVLLWEDPEVLPSDRLWLHGVVLYHNNFGGVAKGPQKEEEELRFFAAAAEKFTEGCSIGDQSGRCHASLGLCFEHGRRCKMSDNGPEKNTEKAVELYREAAARGSASGCVSLGYCYLMGLGVPAMDHARAFELFKRAHLQGNPTGTVNLAEMIHTGFGRSNSNLGVDFPLVVRLLKQSHALGHAFSTSKLKWIWQDDCDLVIPYARWQPLRHVHEWTTEQMDTEIVCLLIASQLRVEGPLCVLPWDVVYLICFYLVCRPRPPYSHTSQERTIRDLVEEEFNDFYVPFVSRIPVLK